MKLNTNDFVVFIIAALVVAVPLVLLVTHCRPETCDDDVHSVQLQHGLKRCLLKANKRTGRGADLL
jgi:hypothetical protein